MAMTHALYAPGELIRKVADDARALRLSQDLSRKSLAARSGVPEATIKKFETTGRVSFESLMLLADAMGVSDRLGRLFATESPPSLDAIKRSPRLRGRK